MHPPPLEDFRGNSSTRGGRLMFLRICVLDYHSELYYRDVQKSEANFRVNELTANGRLGGAEKGILGGAGVE